MIRAILHELRIRRAEWHLRRARRAMPKDAPESAPLNKALDGYADEAFRLARWEKFPA